MDNNFDQEWYVNDSKPKSQTQRVLTNIAKGLWIAVRWLLVFIGKISVGWVKWLLVNPERRICPYCKTDIPYKATRCHRCRKDLKPANGFGERLLISLFVFIIIISAIGCIIDGLGYGGDDESSEAAVVESCDSII